MIRSGQFFRYCGDDSYVTKRKRFIAGSRVASANSERHFSHPKCYASKLNNCSSKISREHFVSHAILRAIGASGPVLTKGLRWQSGSTEQFIPTSRLASNVLCQKHNSALSRLDDEATSLFTFLQDFHKM